MRRMPISFLRTVRCTAEIHIVMLRLPAAAIRTGHSLVSPFDWISSQVSVPSLVMP